MLDKVQLIETKQAQTPLVYENTLSKYNGELMTKVGPYRCIRGAFQYYTLTRPNIAFSMNKLYQFLQCPTNIHYQAVKRLLRYLEGNIRYDIVLQKIDVLTMMA